MNHDYKDITERIEEKPTWWDENAVPRYCEFSPDVTANIYCDEVVFLRIQCQACGRPFKVAMSVGTMDRARYALVRNQEPGDGFKTAMQYASLATGVVSDELHYGDPPNYCCNVGSTMNSIPLEVLEFWTRRAGKEWERVPALEREIDCSWADA